MEEFSKKRSVEPTTTVSNTKDKLKPTSLTEKDDIEAYLTTFKRKMDIYKVAKK